LSQEFRTPLIASLYARYLEDRDATALVRKLQGHYTQGTLERLTAHPLREVRRAAVLALGFIGDYEANASMGRALLDEDRSVRMLAESGIRSVWIRAGNEAQRQQLAIVTRLIAAQRYEEAVRRAGKLLEQSPWFAEGWNQRAIAQFSLARYAESIRDCHETLEINPYHFGAAAGMGQAYLRLGNHASALEAFRRALRLNPDLEGVRVQVVRLAKLVEGKQ
jgi:tetratricopeptide (TPR) repeat protein